MTLRSSLAPLAAIGVLAVAAAPVAAQQPTAIDVRAEVFAGEEMESYLRLLQLTGISSPYPWSIRSFSPGEVRALAPADTTHPWAGRYSFGEESPSRVGISWIRPEVRVIHNSARPSGANDGAIWAGRGFTTALRAGVQARLGPLSATFAPTVFRAENADFDLIPNGQEGTLAYADPYHPTRIDLPQRFGDGAYTRLDPGQSTVRLDALGLAAGVSAANQYWGPAVENPLILGNNAPGFLHGFFGTSKPANLWIGRLHGRLVWGKLEHSQYATSDASVDRLMSGIVTVFVPRGIPGLEVGLTRFFHSPWPENGFGTSHLLKPLEGFLTVNLPETDSGTADRWDPHNQLASVFGRWVLPAHGFEIYSEYAREDHNLDMRDLILEPDHYSAYLIGLQRVTRLSESRWITVRGEVVNSRITHLQRARRQRPFYRHSGLTQGHTHRGQVLGSTIVYGGGGGIIGADYHHPGGRLTVEIERAQHNAAAPADNPRVGQSLRLESLFFAGAFEVFGAVTAERSLGDVEVGRGFNLNTQLLVRAVIP